MDPRGVGQSEHAIDCEVNQETQGLYAYPFPSPEVDDLGPFVARGAAYAKRCRELNSDILPYASTANVARDMDLLRRALGERQISYLGFSGGTILGSTYAALFPDRYRGMVLDGAVNLDAYFQRPIDDLSAQTAGFERALGRFFQACAADQATCQGFGGADPWLAFDRLLERLDANPSSSQGENPRPVDGNIARVAAWVATYDKGAWGILAVGLAQAQAGDGTILRALADAFYLLEPDGTYAPLSDAYFTLTGIEQRWPKHLDEYIRAGERSWHANEHFWINDGYLFAYAFLGIRARDAFVGPFRLPPQAPSTLVIGNRYDPATPYRNSRLLVKQLGRARLLSMDGDGHTSYGQSACIDAAVERYLIEHVLPPEGTFCPHDVPFAVPAPEQAPAGAGVQRRPAALRRDAPALGR
jgi:pimeloyl-ACP methyl ester carboxylesterase